MTAFGFGGQNSMATAEAQDDQRPAPVAPRSQPHLSGYGVPTMEWGNRYAGTQKDQPSPAAVPASMSQQTSHLRAVAQPAAQPTPVPPLATQGLPSRRKFRHNGMVSREYQTI